MRTKFVCVQVIYVEKLKEEKPSFERQTCQSAAENSDSHDCPSNYNTLWDVFWLIRKAVTVGTYMILHSNLVLSL